MEIELVAAGEVLADFTPIGKGPSGNTAYETNPGGAPANMLAAYSALGGGCAFIGTVGDDFFADFLKDALIRGGIDISGVKTVAGEHTTLAFINLSEDMQPTFRFVRGADALITADDIDKSVIDRARAFHFGGVSLSKEPARSSILNAAKYAKSKGKIITFDANYRPDLWENENEAALIMKEAIKLCDYIKLSEEDACLITGKASPDEAAREIYGDDKKAVFITLGKKGVYFMAGDECGTVEAYDVKALDTTGCGDAFMGAVLFQLLNEPAKMAHETVSYACAVSALCATKRGAMPAMPTRAEVCRFLVGEDVL